MYQPAPVSPIQYIALNCHSILYKHPLNKWNYGVWNKKRVSHIIFYTTFWCLLWGWKEPQYNAELSGNGRTIKALPREQARAVGNGDRQPRRFHESKSYLNIKQRQYTRLIEPSKSFHSKFDSRVKLIIQKRISLKSQITTLVNLIDKGKIDNATLKIRAARLNEFYHAYEDYNDELAVLDPNDAHRHFKTSKNVFMILSEKSRKLQVRSHVRIQTRTAGFEATPSLQQKNGEWNYRRLSCQFRKVAIV